MNRIPRTLALAVVLGSLASAACLDESITGTRPLSFAIAASDSTVAVGESVTFQVLATGTQVSRIAITYGDGASDELFYSGAVEVQDQSAHSFQSAGTYMVRGEVTAQQGTARDSVEITVN